MTNAELIAALRRCSYTTVAGADREDGYCKPCAYYAEDSADVTCIDRMMIDAADALEAADKRIDGLLKLVDINTERCEALRKQLREAHENYEKHLNELTTKCNQLQDEVDNYEKRIAELEAQLPKEGEWIEANTRPRSAQFYCSVCHRTCYDIQPTRDKAYTKRCRYHYCPNCGARMRKGEK